MSSIVAASKDRFDRQAGNLDRPANQIIEGMW